MKPQPAALLLVVPGGNLASNIVAMLYESQHTSIVDDESILRLDLAMQAHTVLGQLT